MTPVCSCGSTSFDEKMSGMHLGLYCAKCRQLVKWLRQPVTPETALAFVLPFGKWKGKALPDVDPGYLAWLSKECSNGKIRTMAALVLGLIDPSTPGAS